MSARQLALPCVPGAPGAAVALGAIARAIEHLRSAKSLLVSAGADKAVARVQAALDGALGARRSAEVKAAKARRAAEQVEMFTKNEKG